MVFPRPRIHGNERSMIKKKGKNNIDGNTNETGNVSVRAKIWMKLIGVFLIPVGFIVLLGVISFKKASDALISNYKNSTLSNLNNMAKYLDLGFGTVSDKATLLNTNSTLKNYYSGNYKGNQIEEMKKFKELQEYAYANILSDNIIKNIYIFGQYGNAILTKGTTNTLLYKDFAESEEGLYFQNSGVNKKWIGKHPYLDAALSITDKDYSISLISYIFNNNSEKVGYILLDVSMDFVLNTLAESGLPKESKIAFLMKDGKEIRGNSSSEDNYFIGKEYFDASEIRKLAERSALEAERIGHIIKEIQNQTQITVKTARDAQEEEALRESALKSAVSVFAEIDNNVERLTANLSSIMSSINEIENAKEDTLAAIEEISAISEQTTAAMEQFRDMAMHQLKAVEALNKTVEELSHDSDLLEQKINIFKTNS